MLKLIDRLLEKRLLTRAEAAGDRRFQEVRLTAVGRKLVPHLAVLADKNDEEFFHQLPDEDRKHLVTTLQKLVAGNKLSKVPAE